MRCTRADTARRRAPGEGPRLLPTLQPAAPSVARPAATPGTAPATPPAASTSTSARYRPVALSGTETTASGRPIATTCPPLGARPRPQVDDPIGGLDHFQVVLDHEHRVSGIHQAVQHLEELPHIVAREASRGFVQDVELAPLLSGGPRQLPSDLEALSLTTGQGRGRLSELEVSETDLLELPEDPPQPVLTYEKSGSPRRP